METLKRLFEIWHSDYMDALPSAIKDYMDALPSAIKDRGYSFADNVKQDILITGFNPSFRNGDRQGIIHGPAVNLWKDEKWDNYVGPMKKMIVDDSVDLREKTDYLDIFYFREQEQSFLREKILCNPEGIRFVVDQLNLTMHIIENIVMPKLIVVKNKESWAYFGKLYEEKGWVWMGYRFQHIQNMACGELCRITGLIDSQERIAPEIKETVLCGTFVLFTKHINQFTPAEERPKPALLKTILDWYDAEKAVRSFSI